MTKVRIACLILTALVFSAFAYGAPVRLRCESLQNPLGFDSAKPRLSWQSDNTERNWRQSAYQILVASSPESLKSGHADIWDSGKISSRESVGIAYGGPQLESRKRYYWTVRVWDAAGKAATAAEAAWWETGLLHKQDWKARWITWTNPEAAADREGIRWIWVAGQDALSMTPKVAATFRTEVDAPEHPQEAALFLLSRGNFVAKVNGQQVAAKQRWNSFDRIDLTLKPGKNSIEVAVTVAEPNAFGPEAGAKTMKAALAGLLKITRSDGSIQRLATNAEWQAKLANDSTWQAANVVGNLDDKRLGEAPPLPQPAAFLRKGLEITKQVKQARLYVTALGSYRVFVNGNRVGNDVLTPDFTDYTKRVLYQTYDVTEWLTQGKNAVSAVLGEGWSTLR